MKKFSLIWAIMILLYGVAQVVLVGGGFIQVSDLVKIFMFCSWLIMIIGLALILLVVEKNRKKHE